MISNRTIQIDARHAGQRLDAVLVGCIPSTSRSLVAQAIEKKWVMVNGRCGKKGHKLNAGDTVTIERLLETADWRAVPNPAVKIPVIHDEEGFLVIDKPAGLPVHPLDPEETNTVVNGLLALYPELAMIGPDPLFPAVAHRLDADTSGVMLVARTQEAYRLFRRQFRERRMTKKYVALATGNMTEDGRLEHRLAHSSSGPHRMVVDELDPKAMFSVTEYTIRRRFPMHTLLGVAIRTGVTHQIRCQLAHIGHPLAGDSLYGSADANAGYRGRLFLHAEELSFPDPTTGAERSFSAELPHDLRQWVEEPSRLESV